MVKRSLVFLLLILMISLPTWAVEPLIVDEGGFLGEEETEALGALVDAMEQVFSMEIGTFLLVTNNEMEQEQFKDMLEERYPFSNERNLYFAYDHTAGFYYVVSEGIDELDSITIQDVLDKAMSVDNLGKISVTLMEFYRGIYDFLQPTQGSIVVPGALSETADPDPEVKDSVVTEEPVESLLVPKVEPPSAGKVYLEDGANLWSEEQKEDLKKRAAEISSRENISIILVTTDNNPNKSSEAFINDIGEEKFGIDSDYVGFLIDMDNRQFEVDTSGKVIDILHDQRIEAILDETFLGMEDANYYLAGSNFLKETDRYLAMGIDPDYEGRKERGENNLSPVDGLIGLGAGGLGGFFNFKRVKKSYSKKASPLGFQYQNNLIGGIPLQAGAISRQWTTQRRIPKSSGSSTDKSSTTHSSSSGGTHGGGGRSF